MSKTRTVKVEALARVEGEGGILIRIAGDKVQEVKLRVYEPPRFFEGFLRGRRFDEACRRWRPPSGSRSTRR